MKKIVKFLPIAIIALLLSSCLKSNLDTLPSYSDAKITKVSFEYRWINSASSYDQLQVKTLTTTVSIDATTNTVNCVVTVPAISTDFPQAIRDQVTISNIVGSVDISNAATIKPVGDSPKLGMISDFGKTNMQYEVTAADGTAQIWNLIIVSFTK